MDNSLNKWCGFEGCNFYTTDNDIISMVKKGELDPNALTKHGCTLLIYSIRTNNENIVRFLLDHGACPNLKSTEPDMLLYERVPLMNAFMPRRMKIVNLLLENGADPNLKDRNGESFVDHFELFKETRVTDEQVSQVDKYINI